MTATTIRPWYCSRIVWLGVPGFLFIIWSWVDSFHYIRALHTPDRVDPQTSIVRYTSFHSRVGVLGITNERIDYAQRPGGSLPNRGFSVDSTSINQRGWENLRAKNASPFQAPFATYHRTDKEIETRYFYIGHWFLLVVYTGAWGGLYSWRCSRLRHNGSTLAYQEPTSTEGQVNSPSRAAP